MHRLNDGEPPEKRLLTWYVEVNHQSAPSLPRISHIHLPRFRIVEQVSGAWGATTASIHDDPGHRLHYRFLRDLCSPESVAA